WALLFPPVALVVRRYLGGQRWPRIVATHLALGALLTTVHLSVTWTAGSLLHSASTPGLSQAFTSTSVLGQLIEYTLLAVLAHVMASLETLRRADAELRKSQEQLFQSQKMEAVGRLAGGIAHDFNNLLTVISSYSALVLDELPEGSELRADLEEVRGAAQRASRLTQQLLTFSRRQVPHASALNVDAVTRDLARMLQRLIGENIELVVTTRPGLGLVLADQGHLEQILLNLVVNARDAIEGSGTITVEAANAELDDAFISLNPGASPGSYIALSVSDTGSGMDQETQRRIFEPFFTTKEPGKGTGLGLSTVFSIVQQSGGYISVYSEPGRGTTFRVYLPRVGDEHATPLILPHAGRESLSGSATVLVVEDEKAVRSLIRRILEKHGFRILEASDGHEALRVSAAYEGAIDLLMSDVVLPQLSGRELLPRLKLARPALKVLFMSGYTDEAVGRQGLLDRDVSFLQKPFSSTDLLRRVHEALSVADRPPRFRTNAPAEPASASEIRLPNGPAKRESLQES
ncbi:MAG: ATP-binding protein, partial [Gemmatimonadota bacterium]